MDTDIQEKTLTDERYNYLSDNFEALLTEDEIAEGWHYCYEFDGLLVQGDPKEPICGQACIDWMRDYGD